MSSGRRSFGAMGIVRARTGPRPHSPVPAGGVTAGTCRACIAWLGYYDYRAFGSPLTLPYTVNRTTYAIAPYYVWQHRRAEPVYRHESIRSFYNGAELKGFAKFETLAGFIEASCLKIAEATALFCRFRIASSALYDPEGISGSASPVPGIKRVVSMPGMVIQIFLIPHYLAPFTAVFYAIGLQAMRHLRLWTAEGRPVGLALVRMTLPLCLLLALVRLFSGPLGLNVPEWPASNWSWTWYGPDHYGTERAQIESRLEHLPGKQLVIVRYGPQRNGLDQWVYNSADIDNSKVIWAREMDAANDLDLMHHYKDRKVWLVRMDTEPASVTPYPLPEQVTVNTR